LRYLPDAELSAYLDELCARHTDKETYTRSTLSVGDASIVVYIHESLTPEEVINRLVGHYKAWCVNMPSGRR